MFEEDFMPKFCGRCGTELNSKTGVCSKCNWKKDSSIKNNEVNKAVQSYNNIDISNGMNSSKNTITKKFCGRCGFKLDSSTGLCPRCIAIKTASELDDESTANKSSVIKKIITGLFVIALLAIIAFLLMQGRTSYLLGGSSENTNQEKTYEEFLEERYGDLSADEEYS